MWRKSLIITTIVKRPTVGLVGHLKDIIRANVIGEILKIGFEISYRVTLASSMEEKGVAPIGVVNTTPQSAV